MKWLADYQAKLRSAESVRFECRMPGHDFFTGFLRPAAADDVDPGLRHNGVFIA